MTDLNLEWTEKERMQVMAYVRRLEDIAELALAALKEGTSELEREVVRIGIKQLLIPAVDPTLFSRNHS